jgi:two-component system sensor histidine kinase EvgS
MVHKVKGGAQLLGAEIFIQKCEDFELEGQLDLRAQSFIRLLENQNKIIRSYQEKYRT